MCFQVVFDAALQDGHKVWCLPPGENRQSWGMSLLDLGLFAQGCGQTVEVIELEEGSEAAALVPPPPSKKKKKKSGGGAAEGVSMVDAGGGRWNVKINYGDGGGGAGVTLVAPADGRGAAEGGRWSVSIGSLLAGGGMGGGGGAETKESLVAKVTAKGDEVRAAKAAKADVKPLLADLAALKEQYEAVTGEPYPAGGRAPKKKKGAAAAAAGGVETVSRRQTLFATPCPQVFHRAFRSKRDGLVLIMVVFTEGVPGGEGDREGGRGPRCEGSES